MNRTKPHRVYRNEEKSFQLDRERNLFLLNGFVSKFEQFWIYLTGVVIMLLFFLLLILSLIKDQTIETKHDLPAGLADRK